MPIVEIGGVEFRVDDDGFLDNHKDWRPEWAEFVRKEIGLETINSTHQVAIEKVRSFYEQKGKSPMVRELAKLIGIKLQNLYELFPNGPCKGVCRMAGIPKPLGCV